MRGENLPKRLYGLFIFICVICLLPVFPLAANGATLANLAGTWNYSGFATGPADAPWWERGSLTVASDGTFTVPGTDNNGNTHTFSGAFSFVPDGILMTGSIE